MSIDIEKLLQDAVPDVVEGLKKELKNNVTYEIKNALEGQIKEQVVAFYKENLAEEIKKVLLNEKEGLITLSKVCSETIHEQLTIQLVDTVKKSLENSYTRREILTKLFGG